MYSYGWRPDLPDHRDQVFLLTAPVATPPRVDLRSKMGPVQNQGSVGACTGFSTGAAIEFAHKNDFLSSKLFLYYNGRALEGTTKQDVGASIRDVVKQAAKVGVASDKVWPYNTQKVTTRPVVKAYNDAAKRLVLSYSYVPQTLNSIREVLASGFPIVFGFSVYESFESQTVASTGNMIMPLPDERQLGGHAVVAVGYDDDRKVVIVRNSWSTAWGDHGYFYMPYDYIVNPNLACDFWVIRA